MILAKVLFFLNTLHVCYAEKSSVPDFLNKCYRYENDEIQQDLLCEVFFISSQFRKYQNIKICTGYYKQDEPEIEKYPGTCQANCIPENLAFAPYGKLIGEKTFGNQLSACVCPSSKYGILCDQDSAINSDGAECINGVHDSTNTISGCSCTDGSENPTPYHGWYCDVPNFKLCGSDQFYVHERTKIVADISNGCGSCARATNVYCQTCIQKNERGIFFLSAKVHIL